MYGGPMGGPGHMGPPGHMGGPRHMGHGHGMSPGQMRSNEMAYERFERDAVNFQIENSRPNNFTSVGEVDTYGANNPYSVPKNQINPNVGGTSVQPTGMLFVGPSSSRPPVVSSNSCCQVM